MSGVFGEKDFDSRLDLLLLCPGIGIGCDEFSIDWNVESFVSSRFFFIGELVTNGFLLFLLFGPCLTSSALRPRY